MAASTGTVTVEVTCSICGATVPINVHTRVELRRDTLQINGVIVARPDLADLYAHAWAHADAGEEPPPA